MSGRECKHEDNGFLVEAHVIHVSMVDGTEKLVMEIKATCEKCKTQAQFPCNTVGLTWDTPAVSPDGTELRIPMVMNGSANPLARFMVGRPADV